MQYLQYAALLFKTELNFALKFPSIFYYFILVYPVQPSYVVAILR